MLLPIFVCCVRCYDNILTTRCCFCDRCFVTVVMAFCCGWCCATVVDETTLLWLMLLSFFNGLNHFFEMFCCIRYNSYLMWMADVIATIASSCFIVVDVITTYCWLMLLPNMWWLMLLPSVADGIATLCDGLMLLPCGIWNNHMVGM